MSKLPIYTGGLMRCCIEEIRAWSGRPLDGTVIHCQNCRAPLRIRNGAWEWADDVLPSLTTSNARIEDVA